MSLTTILLLFVAGMKHDGRALPPKINIYISIYSTSWDLKQTFIIVIWFNEVFFWPDKLEVRYLGFQKHKKS